MENSVTPLIQMFEEAEQSSYDERKRNERDRDYYDGKQLTETERKALKDRGQPPVTYNRVRRKINFMLGLEKQARRDPKAFPRNPEDEEAATAATDALRYVADAEDWDDKRSAAWLDMLVPGTGAIMVGVKLDKDGPSPTLLQIPWDRFFADPYSAQHNFSDAAYMGVVTWYDLEDAVHSFGEDARDVLETTLTDAANDQTYDDRPKWNLWADKTRKRVRIVEMYYKKAGEWHFCIFTKAGHLIEPGKSPYLDEDNKPECPIYAVSLYVDRDNNRYGDVRDMIDPQDEVNKRRSKGLHLVSMRQARVGPSATMGPEEIRKQLARPDGIIFGDDVEILNTNDMASQNLALLQEAKNEIDLLGANASLQGKNENDQSGRAILAQQQGGMVEVALHMDRIRTLTLAVYKAIWNRVRQYWKGPRWVRVTDDDRNLRFVGINQPITRFETLMEQAPPEMQQQLAPMENVPEMQQIVGYKNTPDAIDIDIIIDEGMDTPTVQSEQFDTLAKIIPGIIDLPPHYAKMLIMASSLRDKDQMLEALEEMNTADPAMQQMEARKAEAETGKIESDALLNAAKAQKLQNDAEIETFETGVRTASL